jgi:hypothetical protein
MTEVYTGVPTLSLFPMKPCKFKVVRQIELEIPVRGDYNEIAPGVFPDESGEFDFSQDFIYFPAVTKVLLATKQYPDLEANQVFTPVGLELGEDVVKIPGSILEIIDTKP